MSKRIFTDREQRILSNNPNVLRVTEKSITYNYDFKVKAVKENLSGKSPLDIFIENNFNIEVIGVRTPLRCLKRWRQTYNQYGEEGLLGEKRGRGATGRPTKGSKSIEDELAKLKARNAFLEAENEFLKKLEELERGK